MTQRSDSRIHRNKSQKTHRKSFRLFRNMGLFAWCRRTTAWRACCCAPYIVHAYTVHRRQKTKLATSSSRRSDKRFHCFDRWAKTCGSQTIRAKAHRSLLGRAGGNEVRTHFQKPLSHHATFSWRDACILFSSVVNWTIRGHANNQATENQANLNTKGIFW